MRFGRKWLAITCRVFSRDIHDNKESWRPLDARHVGTVLGVGTSQRHLFLQSLKMSATVVVVDQSEVMRIAFRPM
jgi:hypothetical protein